METKLKNSVLLLLFSAVMSSCGYDNYDGPESKLEGRVVYKGEPLHLDFGRAVSLQLWEPGWKKKNKIDINVDQDGAFSALLFDGNYKLINSTINPFRAVKNEQTKSDTILVEMRGNKRMDIEVTPYYLIKNTVISNVGKTVNATFGLGKIITDENQRDVEYVQLFLSVTHLVGRNSDIDSKPEEKVGSKINGTDVLDINSISLTRKIPAYMAPNNNLVPVKSPIYARIGVKLANVDNLIFSDVKKIEF
jgi:Protein of unknown function (DUF3823) N-terminal domain/Domain of unknown function (DUF3823_C)